MAASGMTVLLGGVRSGKSALAVRLASSWSGPVHVIATAEGLDDDMAARIARHRADRPPWPVTEAPLEVSEALGRLEPAVCVIVDCLTLWVANLLAAGRSDDEVAAAAVAFADAAAARGGPTLVVTNEVGMGVHPETDLGLRYRDLLGRVNTLVVDRSARALLLVAGRALVLADPMEVLA